MVDLDVFKTSDYIKKTLIKVEKINSSFSFNNKEDKNFEKINKLILDSEKEGIEKIEQFLMFLALSCNTYKTVKIEDLIFLLNPTSKNLSIKENWMLEENTNFIFEQDYKEKFPEYETEENLDFFIKKIEFLEKKSYLKFDKKRKKISFSKSEYHIFLISVYKKNIFDKSKQRNMLKIAEKILGSLSLNSILITLSILENIYNENEDEILKYLLKRIFMKCLNSIFLSAKSKVISFFDNKITDLDIQEQKQIIKIITLENTIENDNILWNNNVPWFNPENYKNFIGNKIAEKLSSKKINSLLSKKGKISSKNMWFLLNIEEEKLLDFEILKKSLNYNEKIIRARAIKLIFKNYAFKLENIEKYLIKDESYDYIYNLFLGALESWFYYGEKEKYLIKKYFKNNLNLLSVSIKSKKILENFKYEYFEKNKFSNKYSEKEHIELWTLWHEIFIIYIDKYPAKYNELNTPHIACTLNDYYEFIKSDEKAVELVTSIFKWLEKYSKFIFPDNWGINIAEFLMKTTKTNFQIREKIFKELLSSKRTSFITLNIAVFIDYWHKLSKKEKKLIFDLLNSKRQDLKWIYAVILNRRRVPKEINILLFGENGEKKGVSEIVDILIKKDILEESLSVYCGNSKILSKYGFHHINDDFGVKIIIEILTRNVLNDSFKIALKELINMLYNRFDEVFPEISKIFSENLLKKYEKRNLVFDQMLKTTISQSLSKKEMWNMLFENSKDNEKEQYLRKIADNIELIEYYLYKPSEVLKWFDEELLYNKIYTFNLNDNRIFNFCRKINIIIKNKKNVSNNMKDTLKKYLINLYEITPPKMKTTDEIVLKTLKLLNISCSEIFETIETNRNSLKEQIIIKMKKFEETTYIRNWI
jgi:hypothetical protein